jgi:hypothetical protein
MQLDLDISYLGKMEHFRIQLKTRLGVRDAIVSTLSFEPWKPWFFSCFDPSEERFERQFHPKSDILKNQRIDILEFGYLQLQLR